jgi:aspartyl/asparaginyl-tRNA synthetase
MEVVLLAIMHQQMTSSARIQVQIAKKITRGHVIYLEGFWSNSEGIFQNTELVCKKYYVAILSTNISQYLVFWLPQ